MTEFKFFNDRERLVFNDEINISNSFFFLRIFVDLVKIHAISFQRFRHIDNCRGLRSLCTPDPLPRDGIVLGIWSRSGDKQCPAGECL